MSEIDSEQQLNKTDIKDTVKPERVSWLWDNARGMFLSYLFGTDNQTEFGLPFVGETENEVRECRIASSDPTPSDDETDGFAIFSLWLNPSNGKLFVCKDPTEGSAVWKQITNIPTTVTYTFTNTDESTTVTHNLGYTPNVQIFKTDGTDITSGVDIQHDLTDFDSFTVSASINESNLDSLDVIIKYYP